MMTILFTFVSRWNELRPLQIWFTCLQSSQFIRLIRLIALLLICCIAGTGHGGTVWRQSVTQCLLSARGNVPLVQMYYLEGDHW